MIAISNEELARIEAAEKAMAMAEGYARTRVLTDEEVWLRTYCASAPINQTYPWDTADLALSAFKARFRKPKEGPPSPDSQ